MLEKIRKPSRAKNFFAYIIFALICLVFVFLGVPTNPISGGGAAAVVGDEVISIAQLRRMMEQQEAAGASGAERQAQLQKEQIGRLLQQLINSEVIFQSAKTEGLNVSDQELAATVRSFPVFQEEGRFKNALYQRYLSYQRLSPVHFERQIRKSLLSTRVEKLFHQSFALSHSEKERNQQMGSFQFQLKAVKILLEGLDSSKEIEKWQGLLSSPRELNRALKAQGLEWLETPEVSLKNWPQVLSSIADEEELFESVLEHLPGEGLIPKLLIDGRHIVIVRLENFRVNKEARPSPLDVFSLLSSQAVFSNWLKASQEKLRIKINPQYL